MRNPSGALGYVAVAGSIADDCVDVEWVGFLKNQFTVAAPLLARPVGIDFDTVAFRVVQVDCFTHVMIRGTGKGHTTLRRMQNPACQIRARRHQERGVIKAGFARIVWQGIRSVDQLQQGDAADAEYRNLPSVFLHGQTKHVAVVGGDAIEIADHHGDGTDVDRRAARGGGDCRRVGCVHGATIWAVSTIAQRRLSVATLRVYPPPD